MVAVNPAVIQENIRLPKPVIEDTDSIFERLKKIKEEEVEAQKPIGTCQECQAKKVPCTGACYCFCCDHAPHVDIEYDWLPR